MRIPQRFDARPMVSQNTSASGAASSVTIPARAHESICLEAIHLTYNGGVPGGKAITISCTIENVATTIVIGVSATVNVTSIVEILGRIVGDINTAITVTGALLASQTNTLEVFFN